MMDKLEFEGTEQEKHQCISKQEGDWIIYTCPNPECDYERKFNLKTGKMEFSGTHTEILHIGQHTPPGLKPESLNMN